MARGDSDDVLRSLRRYVWWLLGVDEWTVRLQRTRVEDDERPVAVVEASTPEAFPFARTSPDQGDVEKAQGFAVVCYPVVQAAPAESQNEAARVATLLSRGFQYGLVDSVSGAGVGGPFAFPVWDFEGVPVTGEHRQGPSDAYGVAVIDRSFNTRPIQDPVDELRWTVVASLRVSWWAVGRVPGAPGAIVRRIPPTPVVH